MLCVSPYPHHLKERPTNPVLYWLGAFRDTSFDLASADGEHVHGRSLPAQALQSAGGSAQCAQPQRLKLHTAQRAEPASCVRPQASRACRCARSALAWMGSLPLRWQHAAVRWPPAWCLCSVQALEDVWQWRAAVTAAPQHAGVRRMPAHECPRSTLCTDGAQAAAGCAGPWMLDLGDVLYAPTVFTDAQGRLVMLAWMQELRAAAGRLYAGCLSVPRLLTLQGGGHPAWPALTPRRLVQWPCTYCAACATRIQCRGRTGKRPHAAGLQLCSVDSLGRQLCGQAASVVPPAASQKVMSCARSAIPPRSSLPGCAGGKLHQAPVPELEQLRSGASWTAPRLGLSHEQPACLQVLAQNPHLCCASRGVQGTCALPPGAWRPC